MTVVGVVVDGWLTDTSGVVILLISCCGVRLTGLMLMVGGGLMLILVLAGTGRVEAVIGSAIRISPFSS